MSETRGGRRLTLAARVRRATVAVAALSVLVASIAFYGVWSARVLAVRAEELGRQVSALASGLSAGGPLEATGDAGLRGRLLRTQAALIGARLLIVDASGRVAFSTFDPGAGPRSIDLAAFEGAVDGVRIAVRDIGSGERLLLAAAPIDTGTYLVGAQTVRDIRRVRTPLIAALAACMALALVVAWAAGGASAARIAAPIARLREGAEAIAAGRWGHEVPVEGDEETAALAEAFNGMSRRVAAVYEAQKSFVSDVSHEIRTPVASIAGYAQAIEDGTAGDPDTVARFAGIIRSEAHRLADITQTLLALADLDAGRVELRREPVDGSFLSDALNNRFAGAADRLAVDSLEPSGVRPTADPERLLQVASILVENGLKHTPASGRVRVSAETDGTTWSLLVDDEGPGIPPEDRERIFDRFVRLDRARASGGGSGLGLAIARRLVELMEGSIVVTDSPLGGARFIVTLPGTSRAQQIPNTA